MWNPRRRWRPLSTTLAGLASLTLVTGLTLAATPAAANPSSTAPSPAEATVEPQLREELATGGTATFWVYLREQATFANVPSGDWEAQGRAVYEELTATAERTQARLRSLLAEEKVPHQSFWIANAVQVTGDEQLLDRIAALPEVAEITAERVYEIPEPEPAADPPRTQAVEWGIDRVKAPQVWDDFGVTGEGIVVGSIDTGAQYDHPALVEQYRGNLGNGEFDHNYNWWDPSEVCGSPSLVPCDNNGHGTHVTGTMVGDDGGDNQVGMAPGAEWISAKGCESNGCSDAALLSAGQFILAPTDLQGENPDPAKRPHIVNNSWGGASDDDPWYRPTVQAWVAAGIFPQFASGNSGPGCGTAGNPGNLPESYSSGGFDINDNVYTSSSRGPSAWGGIIKPNISAPAVSVRSSTPGNGYGSLTGTSMASPHVSGAVALMWSAAPALVRDLDATRDLLDLTAEDTDDTSCGGEPDNNNVWGQGKLDAFASVDQAPRGDTGELAGTVTDADSGDPISGATVTITGEADRERTTGEDGGYAVTLPVGDYDVTVEAFGYQSQTAQVTITDGDTTVQDFALETVDSVTISGTVTDGSGHGWPLYATVDVNGTPAATFTDPITGEYSVTVPAGDTYTVVVDPQYPGYQSRSDEVTVGTDDVTHDVSLVVSLAGCLDAPGYQLDQPEMAMVTSLSAQFEDYFEGRGVAVDFYSAAQLDQVTGYDLVLWGYHSGTVDETAFLDFLDTTDSEGTGVIFLDHAFTTWNGIKTLSNHTGNPASVSTSTGGSGQVNLYEVTQEHPVLDGFEVGDQIVHEPDASAAWLAWFDGYEGDGRQVIADAGRDGDGILGSGIGVQERANNRHVLMSIHSQSATRGPSGWSADSEQVFWNAIGWASPAGGSFECVPVDGGLVAGQVTDQNTGDGVVGATVASDAAPEDEGTSMATPDDPALADGFYWLFSSVTGSTDFTATAGGYVGQTQSVDVAPSGTTEADFALGAGELTVDPTEVEATHRLGQSSQESFTITNTGTAPAEVDLGQLPGSFEILDGGAQPAALPGGGVDVTPAEGLVTNPDYDPDAPTTEGQYASGTRPQVSPSAAGDLIREWPATGLELPWGLGFDGQVWLSDVPNANDNTAFTVDGQDTGVSHPASWAGTWPADMTYLGGDEMCQVNVGGDNGIHCWDTGSGDVVRSITGSFPWTGVSQRGVAHRPDDDSFYIGGWNENVVYQVAGFSHGTPGEVLNQCSLGSVGVAGMTWNPTAELLWVATNSATDDILLVDPDGCEVLDALAHPEPGFNGGGLHLDGSGNLWMVNQNAGLVYLMESGVPHATDVPWLEHTPEAATLQPGDSLTVSVTMDAGVDEVDQPGTYTATIRIGHDTPYSVPEVEVAMHVTPPNSWGKITGTVTGKDCQGEESPLGSAIVQLNGKRDQVTLRTDGDGQYAYWMANRNNPLQILVATGSHVPQVRNSMIRPRQEVVEDFTLQSICGLTAMTGPRPV